MTGLLGVAFLVLMFAGAAALKALSGLIEEEITGWIEALPAIALRMAAMYLGSEEQVTVYRKNGCRSCCSSCGKPNGGLSRGSSPA